MQVRFQGHRAKIREQLTANRERIRESTRKRYASNREHILKINRNHNRKHKTANREKLREKARKYYAANRGQILERAGKYYEVHRERKFREPLIKQQLKHSACDGRRGCGEDGDDPMVLEIRGEWRACYNVPDAYKYF